MMAYETTNEGNYAMQNIVDIEIHGMPSILQL